MEIWQAIVLGVVEGITEYLPVSSTGHLILASSLMHLDSPENKEAIDAFNIVVQGGAILAVLGLYRGRVLQMLRGLLGRDREGFRLFVNLIAAFLPAAVLGLLLHSWIEKHLFSAGPVLAAVLVGGLYMLFIDAWRTGRFSPPRSAADYREIKDIRPQHAFVIGLMQCVAMWPGTSRSMMTITGGMMFGLRPKAAAEFSFLLGLPTLGAACVYSLYKDVKHAHESGLPNLFQRLGTVPVVVGVVVAAISAAVAVAWLVGFLNRRGLTPFGWYRIALFVVLAGAIASGWIHVNA